jgi:siroheme synthase-like protein
MPLTVMLKVEGRRCLVIGGGKVGVRKARGLRDEGAEVIILSNSLSEESPGVEYIEGRYSPKHLADLQPWMVVAATNSPDVNRQIDADARAAGILTMLVDNPAGGDVRGVITRRDETITVAVSSGSPRLSRYLADRLHADIRPEMREFAGWMRVLRPYIKAGIAEQVDRAALWERIFDSDIMEHVENGDLISARHILMDILGADLAQHVPEIS